jgi:hypothetical protein
MLIGDALGGGRRAIDGPHGGGWKDKGRPLGRCRCRRKMTACSGLADNPLTSSVECVLSMSMARIHIVETKLRGTAPSSVGAYPCLPRLSLDERQAAGREAGNTGSPDLRW